MKKRKKQKEKSYEAVALGEEICYARLIRHMSQVKLAEKVKVSPGWLGRVERGIHLPNIPFLVAIAKALGMRPKDLLPY